MGRRPTADAPVWLAATIHLGTAAALLVLTQWWHFAPIPHMVSADPGAWERWLVAWSAWSYTLTLMLPGLALGIGLAGLRRARLGWWLAVAWSAVVAAFVVFDLRIYGDFGRHLAELAEYLHEETAGEYIGGFGIWLRRLLAWLVACAAGAVALGWALRAGVARAGAKARLALGLATLAPAAALLDHWVLASERRSAITGRVADAFPLASRPRAAASDPVLEALERRLGERFAVTSAALARPAPVDPQATFRAADPPDVLVVVIEGLRHDVAARGLMPKLARWGEQGLALTRHYANANRTEGGLFALLYARWPLAYHATLDGGIPPQATESLRRAGYHTTFLGTWAGGWVRMEEFLNARAFDEAAYVDDGTADTRDRRVLARAGELLRRRDGRPRLVVVFLLSSHLPYVYPPRYAPIVPTPLGRGPMAERLWTSYARSVAFLDDELATLLDAIDQRRTLVVVTGDHGESFADDGKLSHGSRWSDAQSRTLAYLRGPGIPRGAVTPATAHADILPTVLHALAGRHVRIARSSGRDLLEDLPQTDEAILCHVQRDGRAKILAIRDGARLGLRTELAARRLEVSGFEDETGAPRAVHGATLASVPAWSAFFERQLTALVE